MGAKLEAALKEAWTLFDAPHKWFQWTMVGLSGYQGALGHDAAVMEMTFRWTVYSLIVIGGYAKAPDMMDKLAGMFQPKKEG